MPTYTYECRNGHGEDRVFSIHDKRPKWIRCGSCASRATRHFKPPQVFMFKSYVTAHITGEPVEIRSAGHEDELCNRHDKARLLDSDKFDFAGAKKKRSKLARAKLEPMKETIERVENELKYHDRPIPMEATA